MCTAHASTPSPEVGGPHVLLFGSSGSPGTRSDPHGQSSTPDGRSSRNRRLHRRPGTTGCAMSPCLPTTPKRGPMKRRRNRRHSSKQVLGNDRLDYAPSIGGAHGASALARAATWLL
eukprot:8945202-Alexandrium_andersonii.AAC.1